MAGNSVERRNTSANHEKRGKEEGEDCKDVRRVDTAKCEEEHERQADRASSSLSLSPSLAMRDQMQIV